MKEIECALSVCLLIQGVATAAVISITNSSFEDRTLGDGGNNTGAATGWMESGGTIGWFNPSTSFYTSTAIVDTNPSGGTLGDMDGKQVLFFADNLNRTVSQTLTESIVVGNTYTLTVAVGDRDAGGRPEFAGYDIRLLAGGVAVATNSSTVSPGDGTFTDVELVYTAQAGDSGVLGIQIGTASAGSGKSLDVDNVRLVTGEVVADPFITLASLKDRQIVQRDVTGQAELSIAGTFFGEGTEIQVRAIAINGKGTDTGWVTMDSAPSGGSYAGTLAVAEGWYELEVRLLDGEDLVASVSIDHVGVGDIFITCGQSNSANFGTGTPSAADDRVSYMGLTSGTWMHADDPPENPSASPGSGGSPWPKLGDLLSAAHDVPIGFVSIGDGSSSVEDWTPADSDNYPNLQNAVQTLGTNGFRAVLWHQGERDSWALNTPTADYRSRLETVIAASRADAGWDIPWLVALVSSNGSETNQSIIDAQIQVVANDLKVFTGATTDALIGVDPDTGLAYRNGVHFSASGLTAHAELWFDALDDAFPNFEMTGLLVTGHDATLEFTGLLGERYRVETTDSLTNSVWQPVTNIDSLAESPFSVAVTSTNEVAFYRVKLIAD